MHAHIRILSPFSRSPLLYSSHWHSEKGEASSSSQCPYKQASFPHFTPSRKGGSGVSRQPRIQHAEMGVEEGWGVTAHRWLSWWGGYCIVMEPGIQIRLEMRKCRAEQEHKLDRKHHITQKQHTKLTLNTFINIKVPHSIHSSNSIKEPLEINGSLNEPEFIRIFRHISKWKTSLQEGPLVGKGIPGKILFSIYWELFFEDQQ